MNDFAGMEELLDDFLTEASDMLADVDSKLMELERSPEDYNLLNKIFRDFHTIKGGAGFLNANELVTLCHLTENLFDKLRNKELSLDSGLMDVVFAATNEVKRMFVALRQKLQPEAAPEQLLSRLQDALDGRSPDMGKQAGSRTVDKKPVKKGADAGAKDTAPGNAGPDMVDWDTFYNALTDNKLEMKSGVKRDPGQIAAAVAAEEPASKAFGRRASDIPGSTVGRRSGDLSPAEAKETTIRVDISRLDQVLNLSGEIGLTKNRLSHLRSDIVQGRNDLDTLRELDQSVSQLDMLVTNLQNAVMKTRMQPIGRLFKKYPRLARDLARSLGKDIELELFGEETEMDKTMIEDLNDPLVHLVRNAVDHGVETTEERRAANKPEKSVINLSARQEGDHILITITDDGRGINPEAVRSKAVEKGLITSDVANTLDEAQCFDLIFLPGFSTKEQISSVSGRGVGMDVVKTNIQKMNGTIHIDSEIGRGTTITVSLPLTLAILPVLVLRLGEQSFAVPLSMVREILHVTPKDLQLVSGKATMEVRGEVLPVLPLAQLIGWGSSDQSNVGVLMQFGSNSFVLTADDFVGHEDVVIKSLDSFRPKGVAGVTMSSDGDIVLILDLKELLSDIRDR